MCRHTIVFQINCTAKVHCVFLFTCVFIFIGRKLLLKNAKVFKHISNFFAIFHFARHYFGFVSYGSVDFRKHILLIVWMHVNSNPIGIYNRNWLSFNMIFFYVASSYSIVYTYMGVRLQTIESNKKIFGIKWCEKLSIEIIFCNIFLQFQLRSVSLFFFLIIVFCCSVNWSNCCSCVCVASYTFFYTFTSLGHISTFKFHFSSV